MCASRFASSSKANYSRRFHAALPTPLPDRARRRFRRRPRGRGGFQHPSAVRRHAAAIAASGNGQRRTAPQRAQRDLHALGRHPLARTRHARHGKCRGQFPRGLRVPDSLPTHAVAAPRIRGQRSASQGSRPHLAAKRERPVARATPTGGSRCGARRHAGHGASGGNPGGEASRGGNRRRRCAETSRACPSRRHAGPPLAYSFREPRRLAAA